jgi:hypothetical protein
MTTKPDRTGTSTKASTAKKAVSKTQASTVSPSEFVATVLHPVRKADALVLLDWFARVTGMPAVMWGPSIIGYGRYRYEYESGRSGEHLMTGFSPRKSSMTIYIMPGYQDMSAQLEKLGKHKIGKSCLYINQLSDVDLSVLEEMVLKGIAYMRRNYDNWDR